jgi:hypothetical protein
MNPFFKKSEFSRNGFLLSEENGVIMYKVLNLYTNEIVTDGIDYEDAVTCIRKLNGVNGRKHRGRNWIGTIEREVLEESGKIVYGEYGIDHV